MGSLEVADLGRISLREVPSHRAGAAHVSGRGGRGNTAAGRPFGAPEYRRHLARVLTGRGQQRQESDRWS